MRKIAYHIAVENSHGSMSIGLTVGKEFSSSDKLKESTHAPGISTDHAAKLRTQAAAGPRHAVEISLVRGRKTGERVTNCAAQ
jgi:hypothetical protein